MATRRSAAQRRYLKAQPCSNVRRQLRNALRQRDGDACWICGCPMSFDRTRVRVQAPTAATLEHVVEFRDGGGWTLDNLRLSHRRCNQRRSNSANALRMGLNRVELRSITMPAWPALILEGLSGDAPTPLSNRADGS